MECPFCSFENIEGADVCDRCRADLTHLDAIATKRTDIERDLLRRPLADLLTRSCIEVSPDCSVRDAVRQWTESAHRCALVVSDGRIVGIFTERDLLNKLAEKYEQCADQPISRYMTPNPETLDADVAVAFALNRMMLGDYRHIPVTRDGHPAGLVSVRDVFAYLTTRFPDAIGQA